jgi:hypothetical protein
VTDVAPVILFTAALGAAVAVFFEYQAGWYPDITEGSSRSRGGLLSLVWIGHAIAIAVLLGLFSVFFRGSGDD